MSIKYSVLVVSDGVARGKRQDSGGQSVVKIMDEQGHQLVNRGVVEDEVKAIRATLMEWCDDVNVELIITTGGTGLGPRDVTPNATLETIDYEVRGIAEAMRAGSRKMTPMAILSRGVAGVRDRTLIVNLPGNPRGVREMLPIVLPTLPHALDILNDRHGGNHHSD